MDRGVLYYASGERYYKEARSSARSLKKHNAVDITIFTDVTRDDPVFDTRRLIERNDHPFFDRIQYFLESPYNESIYLDTDTRVVSDIYDIFEMFERFDVLSRVDPFRDTAGAHWGIDRYEVDVPDAFPEYQCGVLGFKLTKSVQELFKDWRMRYGKYLNTDLIDQPFFREALFHSDVNIGTLPPEYNLLINNLNCLQGEAKILHFNGGYADNTRLPWKGESEEEIAERINSGYPSRRVVYPNKYGGTEVLTEPNQSRLLSIYEYLRRGLKKRI